jgi:hypothetical protein
VCGWLTVLEPGRPRLLLQAAVVSSWAAQFAISFREVYYGDSLAVVYEAVGLSPMKYRLAFFKARQNQNRMASVISELPPDERICVLSKEFSYPITFLTGRTIQSLSATIPNNESCSYLVILPSDRNIVIPTASTTNWIRDNATLDKSFGDYLLYRIKQGAHEPPTPSLFPLGEQ